MPFDACPSRSLDDLAIRAQRGLPAAEGQLVEALLLRLRPIVGHRLLLQRSWALGEADIEDALHDIVLHIWQHDLPLYQRERSGFLTFVSRRIDWHLADRARNARRAAGEQLDDVVLEGIVDVDKDPESLLAVCERQETLLHLARAIESVRTDDTARTVLVRHDLEGATLVQVAKELHIHVSNACRARQRGVRHLTRHMSALAA